MGGEGGRVRVIVPNATFNNISVISWWSVVLVEETGLNQWPDIWAGFELMTTTSLNTLNRHLGIQERTPPSTRTHTMPTFLWTLSAETHPVTWVNWGLSNTIDLNPKWSRTLTFGNFTADINGALTPLCSWQLTPCCRPWGSESHPSTLVSYRPGNTSHLNPHLSN